MKPERYLSFDIECCDGKHICEFGYVITDTQFNVLEKEVFIINPDKKFNLTGRPDQDDLTLFFSEEEYFAGELFPHYYEKIKQLLSQENQIVVGHALSNDAIFLRTACKRYKLEPINFKFLDSQKVYAEYAHVKSISLERAEEALKLEKPVFLHKSDDDALLTMQLLQKICQSLGVSLEELQELCPTANGKSHYFNIMYTGSSLNEMIEALEKNINALSINQKEKCIKEFASKVRTTEKVFDEKLFGCKMCFGQRFERTNIKETLVLIQLLFNHGCQYNLKISENDYYVASKEELASDAEANHRTRYYAATKHDECKIITFDELYQMLSTTEEDVKNAPWPKVKKPGKSDKKQKNRSYISKGSKNVTIGELLGDQLKNINLDD